MFEKSWWFGKVSGYCKKTSVTQKINYLVPDSAGTCQAKALACSSTHVPLPLHRTWWGSHLFCLLDIAGCVALAPVLCVLSDQETSWTEMELQVCALSASRMQLADMYRASLPSYLQHWQGPASTTVSRAIAQLKTNPPWELLSPFFLHKTCRFHLICLYLWGHLNPHLNFSILQTGEEVVILGSVLPVSPRHIRGLWPSLHIYRTAQTIDRSLTAKKTILSMLPK